MVEQMRDNPKDIYISVRLFKNKQPYEVAIIGFAFKQDFIMGLENPVSETIKRYEKDQSFDSLF